MGDVRPRGFRSYTAQQRDFRPGPELGLQRPDIVQKIGHPLREIEAFPAEHVDKVRDDLSVTTAEEFIDLARRYPDTVRDVLGADDEQFAALRESAAAAAPDAEELSAEQPTDGYPFRTGHDAPPDRKETFQP